MRKSINESPGKYKSICHIRRRCLPENISQLIHLRVSNLYNLCTVNLTDCKNPNYTNYICELKIRFEPIPHFPEGINIEILSANLHTISK